MIDSRRVAAIKMRAEVTSIFNPPYIKRLRRLMFGSSGIQTVVVDKTTLPGRALEIGKKWFRVRLFEFEILTFFLSVYIRCCEVDRDTVNAGLRICGGTVAAAGYFR